jgi:hypothetical protein
MLMPGKRHYEDLAVDRRRRAKRAGAILDKLLFPGAFFQRRFNTLD